MPLPFNVLLACRQSVVAKFTTLYVGAKKNKSLEVWKQSAINKK